MGVRLVVEAAVGARVVVGVEQVVAPAAVEVVAAGAAHDPVVAVVAEDGVVAVVANLGVCIGLLPGGPAHGPGRAHNALVLVEVEEKGQAGAIPRQLARRGQEDLP